MALNKTQRRKVASEFGFRCAICRIPAYQIHHIIEREHGGTDDFDNLIPLCQIHHLHYLHKEKLIKKPELIDLKRNPVGLNDCEGLFPGPFGNQNTVVLGSCKLTDCHPIVNYQGIPIIDIICGNINQPHLYFYCENRLGQPMIKIQDGEWVLGEGTFQFDCSSKHISIRDDIQFEPVLKITLNQHSQIEILGNFYIDKHYIEINSNEFRINGLAMSDCSIEGLEGFRIMKNGIVSF